MEVGRIRTFFSQYFDESVDTKYNQENPVADAPNGYYHDTEVNFSVGRPLGGTGQPYKLSDMEMLQAHRHVLVNSVIVESFLGEYKDATESRLGRRRTNATAVQRYVHRHFVQWFSERILNDAIGTHNDDLIMLARGPVSSATRYTGYDINGYRFRTLDRDETLKTQNSGVASSFGTSSVSSSLDNNPIRSDLWYYGKIVDIVELDYHGRYTTLFKCKWADTINPTLNKIDALGFRLINFSHFRDIGDKDDHESFISASDARLVFYVTDTRDADWCIPIHIKPRDTYEMGDGDEQECQPLSNQTLPIMNSIADLEIVRDGVVAEFN